MQPPPLALIPLRSEPGVPSDPVSLILVQSQDAGVSSTFQASYRIQNHRVYVGGSSNFKRELAAIHPSGRRWESHSVATVPHMVLPSGSARCKGFGPSPEKSSSGNQHDPDFKIV